MNISHILIRSCCSVSLFSCFQMVMMTLSCPVPSNTHARVGPSSSHSASMSDSPLFRTLTHNESNFELNHEAAFELMVRSRTLLSWLQQCPQLHDKVIAMDSTSRALWTSRVLNTAANIHEIALFTCTWGQYEMCIRNIRAIEAIVSSWNVEAAAAATAS